jgi:hypothetical protein
MLLVAHPHPPPQIFIRLIVIRIRHMPHIAYC